ncbi:hypothetical protein KEM52_001537, partial [Ascosphaera acerosa]
ISEVQIIQWYVEEGARIEEWSPLCQYQSDKAVDDITSRYEGVVKRLCVQADDTIETGKPLCEIEVDDQQYRDTDADAPERAGNADATDAGDTSGDVGDGATARTGGTAATLPESQSCSPADLTPAESSASVGGAAERHRSLATPAVRALLKASGLRITDVKGTGKDGRVVKEDVQRQLRIVAREEAERGDDGDTVTASTAGDAASQGNITPAGVDASITAPAERRANLSPIQKKMFQKMSDSKAAVPFLFSDELDTTGLSRMRRALMDQPPANAVKLSILPFVIKAVSTALYKYPILNARIDTATDPAKPAIIYRDAHNIGVAMDTPAGLVVPVLRNVQTLSILQITEEIRRLSELARAAKLDPGHLQGGTFTVSNIGSIGGLCVAPVIVPTEVAILGIGRTRLVPVFNERGEVVRGETTSMSWCADHRVIDGASVAGMAALVRDLLEHPERLLTMLR